MSDTAVEFSPAAAPLAEKLLGAAREILARYPAGRERSALLPLLHLVQTEDGFVTPAGVSFCAEILGINKAQVGAVATFYTMYKRRPTGEYLVSVCTNTLCNVLGGQEVYDQLTEHLGVGHNETTADGKITLEHAECLAACDYAPVVTVNYDFTVDQATPDSAVEMVDKLRNGEQPTPSRGARICSLKEMQFQLAGFADPREGAVGDGVAGAPTLRGVRLAQEHGIAVAGFNLDTPITTTKPAREEQPGKVATAVQAVKAAVGTVAGKAAEKAGQVGDRVNAGKKTEDPQIRTAELRNPTASEPAKPEANAGATTGVAGSAPAGDAKPAGDSPRTPDPTRGSEEEK
ncbi:NADH-quinone oxidoreductase subunit NuoE [Actinoplanes awajinensis]|uniref:NADH-quinone oxidoreductase subunit NuoE n=1 Tax=Actinoplanes awajinensis TaxID=135946 RepID=UPI00082ACF54|nr:NADH-quinone oxidoreductase subunit NuoE [Actinoplanes awajinensis]